MQSLSRRIKVKYLLILEIFSGGFIGYSFQQYINGETTIYDLEEPFYKYPARYVQEDVRDAEELAKALNGHEIILHLAARHQDFGISRFEYMNANEGGARAVVQAASKVGIERIIFFSSVGVYGDREIGGQRSEVRGRESEVRGQMSEITTENTPLEPTNPYGESKLAAERVFLNWAKEHSDRSLIIIRPTVVFGPHNRANMYNLIDQIAKGRYINIGNVPGHGGENTYCPKCNRLLIQRVGFRVLRNNLSYAFTGGKIEGSCKYCGAKISGVWKTRINANR